MDRSELERRFKRVLEETTIPDNASSTEKHLAWTKIYNLIEPNIPNRLFRFRSANLYSIMSFEHNTITLSNPDLFPDKFDSVVYINKEKITKDILTGFTEEYQRNLISEIRQTGTIPAQFASILGLQNNTFFTNTFTNAPNEVIETAMKNNKDNNLNDLLASIPNIASKQIDFIRQNKQIKIACFTENVQSKYMWDMYTSGYKGFALEYDLSAPIGEKENNNPNEKINPILFPVIYSNTMYDATVIATWYLVNSFFISNGLATIPFPDLLYWYKAYLYKDIAYSIEKEWRFMCACPVKENESFLEISCGERLKAIYYGPYMESEIKTHLRNWAYSHKINEYDVSLNSESNQFDLAIKQLN